MTTAATRDKWIKAAQAGIEHEQARKDKAIETAAECQRRIDAAKARIEWLKAMPVEGELASSEGENPATDVDASDVGEEIVDVRALADAMPDEDEPFEYPAPEGEVPERKGIRGSHPVRRDVPAAADDGEPSDWAQDDAAARA